jgi:single stranded DNA-binding protein
MFNEVTLLGNTGRDIEISHTKNGTAVAKFSLATSRRVKQGEEWKDQTTWHICVLYGKQAESSYVAEITKGTQLFVKGEIETRTYKRTLGGTEVDWPVFEIKVTELKKLGSKATHPEKKVDQAQAWDQLGVTEKDLPF